MTRQTELDRLKKDLQEVLKNNGSVLIPTFALGRMEIPAMLALMTREGSCASNPFSSVVCLPKSTIFRPTAPIATIPTCSYMRP